MFHILEHYPNNITNYKNSTLLIRDHWDDWFKFETQFIMIYIDSNNQSHNIGAVKIGQEDMEIGQRSPNLSKDFLQLPNNCFSLGQSDFYYENIRLLGDDVRNRILLSLRDMAYDKSIYDKVKHKDVTRNSLMRDISEFMILHQYHRIANGNARLTKYEIEYTYPNTENKDEVKLNFIVTPYSNPPTNIHVVIGRNNVGKTYLIKNILSAIYSIDDGTDYGRLRATNDLTGRLISSRTQAFANVLCVSFSPFDDYSNIIELQSQNTKMPFSYIGISQSTQNEILTTSNNESSISKKTSGLPNILCNDFIESLKECVHSHRKLDMLEMTISILESDPIFYRSDLKQLIEDVKHLSDKDLSTKAASVFKRLSSGHQVIMLTLAQLIAHLTERTFVILDEPENHLHPPLLSAFIRALSELLVRYNGVALIATHSPVILQEVPRKCVWRINRSGNEVTTSRLEIETFGATIGSLTREVFGLEVRQSGFHKMLNDEVTKGLSYHDIKKLFNNELGDEALALLKTLVQLRDEHENKGAT